MLLGSIRPTGQSSRPPAWLPQHPTLGNFGDLFAKQNFGLYFFTSVLVAGIRALGNLSVFSMAGYAFAEIGFVGMKPMLAIHWHSDI